MHACTLDRHCRFGIRACAAVEKRWIMSIHYQGRGAPKLINGLAVETVAQTDSCRQFRHMEEKGCLAGHISWLL